MAAFGLRVFLGGLQQESCCWGKVICFRLYFPLWWAQAHWVCFGAPRAPPLRAGAQQQIKVHLKSPGRQLPDQVREPPRPCPGAPRGCTEHCRVQASQPGKEQISVPHRSSNERICVKSAFANDSLLVVTTFTIITGPAWLVRMWKPLVDRSNSAGPVRPRQLRRGPTMSRASHVLHRDADCKRHQTTLRPGRCVIPLCQVCNWHRDIQLTKERCSN